MIPHPRDSSRRQGDPWQTASELTGRGCADLHRSVDPAHGAVPLDVLAPPGAATPDRAPLRAATPDDARLGVAAQRAGDRQRRTRARGLVRREAARTPPGGWYAYGVIGVATLPPWAVEVALTVERPVDRHPEGFATRNDQVPEGPALQQWPAQAMALLRAPGRVGWLAGIAEAAAEVEAVAGLRGVAGADGLEGSSPGARSRLLMGPPLPGLVPVPAAIARVRLDAAGERGLAAPVRRRRPASGGHASWRAGAGAVLTCEGPSGASAQAVVGVAGTGDVGAIAPPPGGALVLRAWRTSGAWGAACGLVLGAPAATGLGREAGHVAGRARAAGWDAVVLHGSTALRLARAGDHRQVAPAAAGRGASSGQVAALFEACITAGGVGRPVRRLRPGGRCQ